MTKTIAITGGIGSGKSTFCSKLKEKGFKIHSSDDQVAKIYKNPDKYFTDDIMKKLNDIAVEEYSYGAN